MLKGAAPEIHTLIRKSICKIAGKVRFFKISNSWGMPTIIVMRFKRMLRKTF